MGDNHYTESTDAITDSFDALESFADTSDKMAALKAYRDMALTLFGAAYDKAKARLGVA